MKRLMLFFLLFMIASFLAEANAQGKWVTADIDTKRLSPKSFTELPKVIINDLERRRCKIPQSYFYKKRHNVVGGEFKRKGQKDWAILCSVNRSSSILVYWNSSAANVSKIAGAADSGYLTTFNPGMIGFSRIIGIADTKFILDHYKAYGGPKPPRVTHQGINDGYAETASVVRYLHRGKWLELQGAD